MSLPTANMGVPASRFAESPPLVGIKNVIAPKDDSVCCYVECGQGTFNLT